MTNFAKIVEETLHAKEFVAQTVDVLEMVTDRERRFRDTFGS